MKLYINVTHEIEVDDKYLPLLTSTEANFNQLQREFCTEVSKIMKMPFADEAKAGDKQYINAVCDNCWEPIIET